jgi:hypothetical protein
MGTKLDQFPLEAEISLSELRSEETLTSRLQTFHRLRVRRRSDFVGVFLDVGEWQRLVSHVSQLEAELELHEDEAARAIVALRAPGAAVEPGSPSRIAEIDREYQRLVADRAKPRGRKPAAR